MRRPPGKRGELGFAETADRIDIALAVPVRDGKLLVARRPPGAHLEGAWEFPGGKVEAGEDPAGAARRELEEETGLRVERLEPLVVLVHDYTDRPLRIHTYLAWDPEGEPRLEDGREWAWKSLAEVRELEMPEANRRILRALRWRL